MIKNIQLLYLQIAKYCVNKIIEKNPNVGILMNGSLAWGGGLAPKNSSDIDLDIIFDTDVVPDLSFLSSNYPKFKEIFKKLISADKADYGSWKTSIKNKRVGIHLVPKNIFEKVCETNFISLNKTTTSKEYRLEPKDKRPTYTQYNFWRKSLDFEAKVNIIPDGRITHTPLAIIKNGKYYNGLLVDKYLSYPIFYTNIPSLSLSVEKLKKNLIGRMVYERNKFGKSGAKLSNLLHAKDKIHKCDIDRLDLEAERVILQLQGKCPVPLGRG